MEISTGCQTLVVIGDCGGCGGVIAPFFFISYKILCDFVMVNLIVPVVLDYYRQSAIAERADVPRENLEDFEQVCSENCNALRSAS